MPTIQPQERQLVLDQLAASEARLFGLVRGLTPAQWNFQESPERWSIAEIMEHVVVFENFIMQTVARILSEPPDPSKKDQARAKEHLAQGIATGRDTKFKARQAALPTGRWPDPAEMMEEFRKIRARTVAFVARIQADLREHFFPHVAFGDLDAYQWLVVVAQHGSRHALQIEEVMAHPDYPLASRK